MRNGFGVLTAKVNSFVRLSKKRVRLIIDFHSVAAADQHFI